MEPHVTELPHQTLGLSFSCSFLGFLLKTSPGRAFLATPQTAAGPLPWQSWSPCSR